MKKGTDLIGKAGSDKEEGRVCERVADSILSNPIQEACSMEYGKVKMQLSLK